MEITIYTPKVTLVPASFFSPETARKSLEEVVYLNEGDEVDWVEIPEYSSMLVFCSTQDDSIASEIKENGISGIESPNRPLPEMFHILSNLSRCEEYNKILCSYRDGYLHMAIAQGNSLLLANCYKAPDFTTAEYFIFLAMKSLQLNPEVSTICWRTQLSADEEMSLYRYFRAVDSI